MQPLESLSIVVPVYNEAGVIERVLRDLHTKVAARQPSTELIVAEDGSTDGTKEILRRLEPELGLRLVMGDRRKGYTNAVKDALRLPTSDWVLFSDSDGQQEPDDFYPMATLAPRYDLIVGFKSPRRDPWPRLLLSRGMRLINRLVIGASFRDANCGFRLMRKSVIDAVLPRCSLLPQFVNTEFTLRAWHMGYRVTEVPVRHYEREDGGSRGLPAAKIPGEVSRLLGGLATMRREFKNDRSRLRVDRAPTPEGRR